MPTKRKFYKNRKSRKHKIRGGNTLYLGLFIEQLNNASDQNAIDTLVMNPDNQDYVNSLMNMCYDNMLRTNNANYELILGDGNLPMNVNPINILIKLMKAPYKSCFLATNKGVFCFMEASRQTGQYRVFDTILMFMFNTDSINRELINLLVLLAPTAFVNQLEVDNFFVQHTDITLMFLEEYINNVNKLEPEKVIIPLLNVFAKNIVDNDLIIPFFKQVSQEYLFYYLLRYNYNFQVFEQLFLELKPNIDMPLTGASRYTMLEFSILFGRNAIALFLINQGAHVSNNAFNRILSNNNISPELLEQALTNNQVLPDNALEILQNSYPSANRTRKIEIVEKWQDIMLAYGFNASDEGKLAMSYGLK